MMYTFFGQIWGIKANVNEVLAQKLHKPVIKNAKNFKDKNCTADLTEMGNLKIVMLNIYYESYKFSPRNVG